MDVALVDGGDLVGEGKGGERGICLSVWLCELLEGSEAAGDARRSSSKVRRNKERARCGGGVGVGAVTAGALRTRAAAERGLDRPRGGCVVC